MKHLTHLPALAFTLPLSSLAPLVSAEPHTFTNTEGKTIQAEITEVAGQGHPEAFQWKKLHPALQQTV